ncbi:MAG TPA: cytochrome d ubiquinol oxidase subunit II [Desulfuromonadaceae bacterium]|jgi:cytochrome d ubiquinol oxidase subunit II
MELQITWFVLWGILWSVYFMLDGFVLGTGFMSGFLAKSDIERRVLINTVGPIWDGNEVWLITAGGATFAAFPTTYALMFSNMYSALLLLLFALIVRGVAFEFRGKLNNPTWKKGWDIAISVCSFLPALLFGVAFGNIFKGLPMHNDFAILSFSYEGGLLSLLNPYGLLTGVLFVMLFALHGCLYIAIKTTGNLAFRSSELAKKLWLPVLLVAVAFLGYTYPATRLYNNYFKVPLLLIIPAIAVTSLLLVRVFAGRNNFYKAFIFSCLTIVFVVFTGITGLFPNLIPSNIDLDSSLTIYNSSSSPYTLKVMTIVAFIFLPIIIAYKTWVYRIFRARITSEDISGDSEAY